MQGDRHLAVGARARDHAELACGRREQPVRGGLGQTGEAAAEPGLEEEAANEEKEAAALMKTGQEALATVLNGFEHATW